jgi:hypothetical protein
MSTVCITGTGISMHEHQVLSSNTLHNSLSLRRQLPRSNTQILTVTHEEEPPLPELPSLPDATTTLIPLSGPQKTPHLLPHNNHPNPRPSQQHIQPLLGLLPHLKCLSSIGDPQILQARNEEPVLCSAGQEGVQVRPVGGAAAGVAGSVEEEGAGCFVEEGGEGGEGARRGCRVRFRGLDIRFQAVQERQEGGLFGGVERVEGCGLEEGAPEGF